MTQSIEPLPEAHVPVSLQIVPFPIPVSMLDYDSLKVVWRLKRFGYEAYLVGGCIRDLLLGKKPKDFDVVTSARPPEIKRLFHNCRLIGNRFRLAHILFRGGKIVEVATFRRCATAEDDLSVRYAAENLFGEPVDDALRRDFTINALMYDVTEKSIHDYVGGLEDVKARVLHTIGDPDLRFVEDPVRIIRAVKFSNLLNLTIKPDLMSAMKRHANLVESCATARVVEELLKIFRSGASARCFAGLCEIGALAKLMPALDRNLSESGNPSSALGLLERADSFLRQGEALRDETMLSALLYPFCRQALVENGDVAEKLDNVLMPLVQPLMFTKRHMARVRQIFLAQHRLSGGKLNRGSRKILQREYAEDAIDFMAILAENPESKERAEQWRKSLRSRRRSTDDGREHGRGKEISENEEA